LQKSPYKKFFLFESDFIRPTNIILSRFKNMSSVLQKNFANFYFLIVFAISKLIIPVKHLFLGGFCSFVFKNFHNFIIFHKIPPQYSVNRLTFFSFIQYKRLAFL